MGKTQLVKAIVFSAFLLLTAAKSYAQTLPSAFSPLDTSTSLDSQQSTPNTAVPENVNQNEDGSLKFACAIDKFAQCNIRASWEDFKNFINNAPQNDFLYIAFANKMSELGFFDLASLATSKMKDKEITGISKEAMERFYYPRRKLKIEDELFLAEIYSDIMYNNQSSEATAELLQNENLLLNYDYANYLAALGSYKSGMFSQAKKYINLAIIQNPANLNYQRLKAEILAEDEDGQDAIKVVNDLKKQDLYSFEYSRKIKSLEQFVLYKTSKAEWEKNYHLGYYYYLENDKTRAARALQDALSTKKAANKSLVYALMGEIYLNMDEFEKASDSAKRAHKINHNNPKALITLGDLSYRDKNYKRALEYYKRAASHDKKAYEPLIKEAQTYQKLSNGKKAKELYIKTLKTHSDSSEAYYNIALVEKDKEIIYLKKALGVNPMFEDGWIQISKAEINKGNYELAQKYLANAFYIDENDFRYYYYQGLVNKNLGNYLIAKDYFRKCLKLNSGFKDAQDELNNSINAQGSEQSQGSI